MIIERRLTPYLVFHDESVVVALRKMTGNAERIVFVVDGTGQLLGSLTDGDFRRWIVAHPEADLEVAVQQVANPHPATVGPEATEEQMRAALPAGASHLPVLDERGRITAIAIDRPAELRIGDRRIDESSPAYVIAEIGNNHQGSVDQARRLVDLAAEAGADAVKFQLRDMDTLYRQSGSTSAGEDLGAQYTLDLLAKYSLPAEQLFRAFDHAREHGIQVLCTPWDEASVTALADYGLPALKIASADLTNHGLLRAAGSHGLPLILSTGMSREAEIRESAAVVRSLGVPFAMLHCQSTYPAPYKDVNLAYMDRLAEITAVPVGYSGHERGWHVPLAAVARGAKIIEKHFTTDRELEGSDHRVSLLPDEFRQMMSQIRDIEQAMGTAQERTVSTGEAMNRTNLAKSLVAAGPICAGQRLGQGDIEVRSPGRGLQPDRLSQLVGRTAHRDMGAGDFFFEGDLLDAPARGRDYSFRRPWGLPVRYHDALSLLESTHPDFLEFHFSYKDLEIDIDQALPQRLPMGFTTHLPDLFAGDFLVDLSSRDPEHWERSIAEVQRTIDVTRALRARFTQDQDPIMVVTMGGFTSDGHLSAERRADKYQRIADALKRLDSSGVRIAAQTLPPFPWLMGGQQFHNLFLDPQDTADFARSTGTDLCLDISHTRLAATFLGISFAEAVETLAPLSSHLHLVDGTGVDGEGVQVGEGDVDWPVLAEQLDRLAPGVSFIPEIWQGHVDGGAGFWTALERLEPLL
ncbi:N-acetylneuraminate synthase family protein [Kocuria palustris]|uniref:N-acetylneuraminate synthase family protein n=1 Tax=Kocuria palustris TaxID=71999 RepID=UPI0019561066|nr:N-acetylneuraminate synthase family protein [Kocuria palustris]MBM7824131.1 N-acetylneuraminate synthase [Kocuria palustris]MDH5151481.1 N-acetylneuraminate synthase family protein [Kocuria palustris]